MIFLLYTEPERLISSFANIATAFSTAMKKLNGRGTRKLLLAAGCLALVGNSLIGQVIGDYGSAAVGPNNWSVPASWVVCATDGTWTGATTPSDAPTSSNNVWILSGHTIVLDPGSACKNLTVESGGILNGIQQLDIYGNLLVNGQVSTNSPINLLNLIGSSVGGSGSITATPFGIFNNMTIPMGSSLVFNCEIKFSAPNLAITNNGLITLNGSITENSVTGCSWTNATNSYLSIFGNIADAVILNASAPGNTVNYLANGDQNIKTPSGTTKNYFNLTVTGSGTKTLFGSITVDNDLTISGSATLNCAEYQITGNTTGLFLMAPGSTLLLGEPGSTTDVAFPTIFTRITLDLQSTVIYQSKSDQTISAVPVYGNLTTATSGTKTLNGAINVKGNLEIGEGTILDVSTSNYPISIEGNWTDYTIDGFYEESGTVTFTGANIQSISKTGGETFYGLTVNKTGNQINLSTGNTTVLNLLTLTIGNIDAGTNVLILSPTSAGSLIHTSGTIIGKFRRGVSVRGDYLFPVGTSDNYRPATFNFSSLGSLVDITAEFISSSPDPFTPYIDDVPLNNIFQDGYWHFSSSLAPAHTYTLDLTGNGFSSFVINNFTRITGRNSIGTWQAFGTHGAVNTSTITRTGISNLDAASFDYTFARSLCTDITAEISGGTSPICCNTPPGLFTATGSGGIGAYTYQWYSTSGIISGETSSMYSPGNIAITTGYYCAITSGLCGTVNTATTTITVYGNLTAGINPGNTSICYNTSPGTFTATGGGGTGSYTYLWYRDGSSTGVTTQTYAPGALTSTSTFYCAITSG